MSDSRHLVPDWMMAAVIEQQRLMTESLFRLPHRMLEPSPSRITATEVIALRRNLGLDFDWTIGPGPKPKPVPHKESFEDWRARTAALIEEQRARRT